MKHLKRIIALLLTTAIIFSCNPKESKPTTTTPPVVVQPGGKKALVEVLSANEIQSLTEMINLNLPSSARGKPIKLSQIVNVAASAANIINNGGSSFSINYGSMTNLLTQFFRGGDSLAANGNVYPTGGLQYPISETTFTAYFSRTYYQSLVVQGTMTPDANGVIGSDWVFTYTNVVN